MKGDQKSQNRGLHVRSRKNLSIKGEDRLTNLPEGVLGEIISLLPIEDAVRTSILSKAWKSKWTLSYNAIINGDKLSVKSRDNKAVVFLDFVSQMVLHLQNLKKFHLKCPCYEKYEFASLVMWIDIVLSKHKLESLELRVFANIVTKTQNTPFLAYSLVSSLKNLVVEMPSIFEVAVDSCFANLTRLFLCEAEIVCENSNCDTLKFTFSVLRKITFSHCKWLNVKYVELYAPSLTKFKSITPYADHELRKYSINIIGARLAKFKVSGGFPEDIILKDSTVDCAVFNCDYYDIKSVEWRPQLQKLLTEVSSAKSLWLSGYYWGMTHPWFEKLEKLHVSGLCTELIKLLHGMPILRFLVVDVGNNNYQYVNFESVELVPSCMLSHLEEIVFKYARRNSGPPQFHLEKFILKHALQLKEVWVDHFDGAHTIEIAKQLGTFPKASAVKFFAIP